MSEQQFSGFYGTTVGAERPREVSPAEKLLEEAIEASPDSRLLKELELLSEKDLQWIDSACNNAGIDFDSFSRFESSHEENEVNAVMELIGLLSKAEIPFNKPSPYEEKKRIAKEIAKKISA